MELKPIKNYDAYIFTENKRLYGIDGNATIQLYLIDTDNNRVPISDFFKIDGALYFTVKETVEETEKTLYFYQIAGNMNSITKAKFPAKPDSDYVEMSEGMYKITTVDYAGGQASYVYKGPCPTGFKKVDSYHLADGGLWFSVAETAPHPTAPRLKGVYFFPDNATLNPPAFDSGRVW